MDDAALPSKCRKFAGFELPFVPVKSGCTATFVAASDGVALLFTTETGNNPGVLRSPPFSVTVIWRGPGPLSAPKGLVEPLNCAETAGFVEGPKKPPFIDKEPPCGDCKKLSGTEEMTAGRYGTISKF